MYSFSYLEPICCSMSSSNCCFLTCIQISQEAGQVAWYSHLCKNFPQFMVIHIVKGFGIIKKAEIDVFLELSCFLNDPEDVDNLISGSSVFSKTSLNIWKFTVHVLLKLGLHSQWKRSRCYSGILLLFWWPSGCWQFDLWFLCLFKIQLEHLEVHSSCIVEASLGEFWALLC